LDGLRVFEPCVGQGDIARHLRESILVTNDIDPNCQADTHRDARLAEAWPSNGLRLDWVVSNPPFSDALPILEQAIRHSRNVAMLVRLSFLEPTRSRAAFWLAHQPTDLIILPRYSFRLNDSGRRQTDSVTCCWLVFLRGCPADSIHFSRWREQRPRRALVTTEVA
jgi:hypothetical protein